jgi:hypothetical protein
MAGTIAVSRFGPDSFPVSANATTNSLNYIDGGILVVADAASAGTVIPAPVTGTTVAVLGVNLQPAVGPSYVTSSIPGYGGSQLDYSVPDNEAVVGWQGTFKLTWDGQGTYGFGKPVYTSAVVGGQASFTTTTTMVGICVDPNAPVSGGQVLVRFTGNVA